MCGIVGFTGPGRDAEAQLRAMMATIAYRGPDESGIFIDHGIAVGHLRLTVIAPDGGHQPCRDPESGDVLAFNGEIYRYRDHAARLRAEGVQLRDASDTEVLFQMIRHFGMDRTLESIDGMFAFVFREGGSGEVTLVRDRFGEKPMLYAVHGDQIVFGSEMKALRAHPACAVAAFDETAIREYLSLDYVPAPRTGLKGVAKLRPGEVVRFRDGSVSSKFYWRPEFATDGDPSASRRTFDEHADMLSGLIDDAIASRLVADVPVGLFLSGGIDSALIAARASRLVPGITAYTMRFPGNDYDETPYAAAVAKRFGLRHVVRDVGQEDLVAAADAIAENLDEPFADNSIIPTYLICRAAREDVTVALGGDGGDELFAGYVNFRALQAAPLLAAMPGGTAPWARRAAGLLPTRDAYMGLGFMLGQFLNGWGEDARIQPFQWMAAFSKADQDSVLEKPEAADPLRGIIERELADGVPDDPVERLQYLFCRLYLANDILTKVDRASMYNSLEVRAPFLARTVAEYAFRLPVSAKLGRLESKRILRHLAARELPADIVKRPKHGFALPVASMMKTVLRDRIEDTLRDRTNPIAGMFRKTAVEQMIDDHMAGRRDHRKRLWSLYCLYVFADRGHTRSLRDDGGKGSGAFGGFRQPGARGLAR